MIFPAAWKALTCYVEFSVLNSCWSVDADDSDEGHVRSVPCSLYVYVYGRQACKLFIVIFDIAIKLFNTNWLYEVDSPFVHSFKVRQLNIIILSFVYD